VLFWRAFLARWAGPAQIRWFGRPFDWSLEQLGIVGSSGDRIGQADQGLGQAVHTLCHLLGVRKLIAAEPFHALLDAVLDPRGFDFPRIKTQERVVVGRPMVSRELKARADQSVAHDRRRWGTTHLTSFLPYQFSQNNVKNVQLIFVFFVAARKSAQ